MNNASALVREARAARGITVAELAARIGAPSAIVDAMETDEYDRHTLTTLTKVADALDYVVHVTFVPKGSTTDMVKR